MRRRTDSAVHLRRARDFIDRRFADSELRLDDIAAAALMSRSHLVREFARQYGVTPGAYLSLRRLERAQDLLRFANLTVTEVCHNVGFTSIGSFSTAFAQRFGETPSAFQRRWSAATQPRIPGCEILMRSARDGVVGADRVTQEKRERASAS
ncbi:helix-turn-helix transcriptional regulator [Cryptosporangium sp. NPDC048952]|uniref:helix-turn-helix transcriptional regulator n=1 Tax=Cryptosporangium sp. NPDC048952 TaxID=3363961 RepID=UPI00371BC450